MLHFCLCGLPVAASSVRLYADTVLALNKTGFVGKPFMKRVVPCRIFFFWNTRGPVLLHERGAGEQGTEFLTDVLDLWYGDNCRAGRFSQRDNQHAWNNHSVWTTNVKTGFNSQHKQWQPSSCFLNSTNSSLVKEMETASKEWLTK